MQVSGYGITLERLTQDRIELLREWRNTDSISRYMEYREHITPEMQQRWFNGLHPLNDFYFIIVYQSQAIGLIHTSGIDWAKGIGHAGLFIFEQRYLSTHIPVLASVSMLDALFGMFPLAQVHAKVKKDNAVAADYNIKLGFKLEDGEEGKPFQQYLLLKETYFINASLIRKSAKALGKEGLQVEISETENSLFEEANILNEKMSDLKLKITAA